MTDRLRADLQGLRDYYAAPTRSERTLTAGLVRRLDALLAGSRPATPGGDELVHWSPGRAGAFHEFSDEAVVTRVRQEITCPTCLDGLVRAPRANPA